MSSSSNLFSHPERLLEEHLHEVATISQQLLQDKTFAEKELLLAVVYLTGISHDFAKATRFFQEKLFDKKRTIKSQHSALSAFFGYYLVNQFLEARGELTKHKFLPVMVFVAIHRHHSNLQNFYGADSLNKHLKEEFNVKFYNEQLASIEQKAVIEIYDNLLSKVETFKSLQIAKIIADFFAEFQKNKATSKLPLLRKIITELKYATRTNSLENYFTMQLLYSILLDADKLSASRTPLPSRISRLKEEMITNYKLRHFKKSTLGINKIREETYQKALKTVEKLDLITGKRILSLTLPTGCGKTLTALAVALKLRERIEKESELNFSPKIIYSLPFLSIIDQNSEVIQEILKENGLSDENGSIAANVLLKHHHLAEIVFNWKREKSTVELPVEKALLLTESWHSEIIITTFVQFFHSLFSFRNRTSRKFHNIINTIIILDEIQSLPHEYWFVINELLTFLAEKYHCWVIIVTATRPLIFPEERVSALIPEIKNYYQAFDRVVFKAQLEGMKLTDFQVKLLKEIEETNYDIMVVVNTISACKKLYGYIKEQLTKQRKTTELTEEGIWRSEKEELYCLTTHIIPEDRLARIKKIAEEKKSKRKIIISTQLIEAGVDISVEKIYRDFAPLDCIIQTAGRCNRNNNQETKGQVVVIQLENDKGRRFASFIYDSVLLEATEKLLKKLFIEKELQKIPEHQFTLQMINEYFKIVKERKATEEEFLIGIQKLQFNLLKEFKLIKERVSLPVFIEINDKATDIRMAYEKALEKKRGYKKRIINRKFRKQLNDRTINIAVNTKDAKLLRALPNIGESEYLFYVPKEFLQKWYERDIGFEPKEEQLQEMRFL